MKIKLSIVTILPNLSTGNPAPEVMKLTILVDVFQSLLPKYMFTN